MVVMIFFHSSVRKMSFLGFSEGKRQVKPHCGTFVNRYETCEKRNTKAQYIITPPRPPKIAFHSPLSIILVTCEIMNSISKQSHFLPT